MSHVSGLRFLKRRFTQSLGIRSRISERLRVFLNSVILIEEFLGSFFLLFDRTRRHKASSSFSEKAWVVPWTSHKQSSFKWVFLFCFFMLLLLVLLLFTFTYLSLLLLRILTELLSHEISSLALTPLTPHAWGVSLVLVVVWIWARITIRVWVIRNWYSLF